ncbi:hypothetical protein C8Q72DRAFT_882980 [Fomitopsis betulina]|nr:hypothetical protein C8Q72DRAFT_882980 [Fomitopsis betulina]
MPAPAVTAVYIVSVVAVVAGAYAFKEFVYEPHIAPKLEAWADSFLEGRRRQRARRQGPIAAQPVHERGNENNTRRSGTRNGDVDRNMSVELEQLVAQEASAWSDNGRQDGLRRRNTGAAIDESNTFIPYRPISPTHVIFDSSVPSTPTSTSTSGSRLQSPRAVAAPALHSPSPRVRLSSVTSRDAPQVPPTPVSFRSLDSSRIQSPDMDMISSRSSSPDAAAMYNTALMGSVGNMAERTRPVSPDAAPGIQSPLSDYHMTAPVPSLPPSRIQSPFSDIHAVTARSPTLSARSGAMSPFSQWSESEFDMPLDDDDVTSMRSGMFSPDIATHQDDLAFEVLSAQGSDDSWGSVGRRAPGL